MTSIEVFKQRVDSVISRNGKISYHEAQCVQYLLLRVRLPWDKEFATIERMCHELICTATPKETLAVAKRIKEAMRDFHWCA